MLQALLSEAEEDETKSLGPTAHLWQSNSLGLTPVLPSGHSQVPLAYPCQHFYALPL